LSSGFVKKCARYEEILAVFSPPEAGKTRQHIFNADTSDKKLAAFSVLD
jgi:hypothetical protein